MNKLWEKNFEVNAEIERFTVGRDREMDLWLLMTYWALWLISPCWRLSDCWRLTSCDSCWRS